jgi:hypothetical protein
VSSSFLLVVFFSGGLPFALVWLGLELLSSSLFLSRYSMRVALFNSAHRPPPPRVGGAAAGCVGGFGSAPVTGGVGLLGAQVG